MQDFKNLEVWAKARRLIKAIYEMTAALPVSERFGLSSQMRRASVSICANIAEGCGHRGDLTFDAAWHRWAQRASLNAS